MTVGDLKKILKILDDDIEVYILQHDGSGGTEEWFAESISIDFTKNKVTID